MSSSDEIRVITLQPKIELHNLRKNLKNYNNLIQEKLDKIDNIDIICFPEYWNGLRINSSSDNTFLTSIAFLKDVAQTYSAWIVGGSLITEEENEFYNRSFLINPKGKIIGKYDKNRLFGYEKTQEITSGKSQLKWNVGNFRVGIRICNDLWNLNLTQDLISKEIDICFVPALTVVSEEALTSYGQYIWHNLAFIRAKEGAMAIVVSDTAKSVLSDPYWSTSASCIADPSQKFTNLEPRGKNMLKTIESGGSGIITKTISLRQIQEQRTYRKTVGLLD